jgi:hypothetical protein
MIAPVNVPVSATNPHAAGVEYVPLVSCVPSEEIVPVPVEVPVPSEPDSVNVRETV